MWTFGDGTNLTTDWAGKAWAKGDDVSKLINHLYTSTKDVKASVTTSWGAKVRLNGGPPQLGDGTLDVISPEVPLAILEAKPTLVRQFAPDVPVTPQQAWSAGCGAVWLLVGRVPGRRGWVDRL